MNLTLHVWRQKSSSDKGRFVAFASDASNLVSGDPNDASDVFVRDRDGLIYYPLLRIYLPFTAK